MVISTTEQGIIVNSMGFIGTHEQKITNLMKSYAQNPTAETENLIKDEVRKMRRLLNTIFTRNSLTAETRGYSEQDLIDMRIKLD